jgi:ribosomal protein S18 acetylase RimI-like enzyme
MKNITICPITATDIPAVTGLQRAYTALYPDAPVIPGEYYLSPVFENGRNVFCAWDDRRTLVGYAPLYPVLMHDDSSLPHTLWTEIKAHPGCDDSAPVKDRLLEQILMRSRDLTREEPGHPVHLTFQYYPSEISSVEYVTSRGCCYTESVFRMRRDLSREIPVLAPPKGITICPWRMESQPEQQQYVQARNECFPEAPITLEEWQYFTLSPHWSVGTTFAAIDGGELAGNVAFFWNEAENLSSGKKIGFTEYIFVRPRWRGKNLARCLVYAGLAYLKGHDLEEAHLEVRARNASALHLYLDLGYEVLRESRFYVMEL